MASKDTDCVIPTMAVSEANNHLAIQLYKLLAKEQTNLFFSPFSLSTAFAMLFCGSEGETANEIRQVLGYGTDSIKDQDIKSSFESLLDKIESNSDGYTLTSANSVLCDKAFSVKQGFKTLLEESFKALMEEVDFRNESENAIKKINTWVAEKTNNMIPQLLDSLDPETVMIILNAVYFKGAWLNQFKGSHTFLQYFYNKGIEDEAKLVEVMHLKESFLYIEKESFKALQMPYKGNDIAILILLPRFKNGLKELEKSLTPALFCNLTREMVERKVEVALPKFRLEYAKSLSEQFQAMGMNRAFCHGAEFGGISDSKELAISKIIHKAVFEVNEEGVEAAAATAIEITNYCFALDPEFIVDRPFLFIIHHLKMEIILFMGRVDELSDYDQAIV